VPHKLMISYRIRGKAVREQKFGLILKFTNIGDKVFSGGRITSIRLELSDWWHSITRAKLLPVPRIEPRKSIETKVPFPFVANSDGLGWLTVSIEADDGKPVEHYEHPGHPMGDKVQLALYVVNREQAHIISLLEQMIQLLKGLPHSSA
jgi:hypothetical protein